MPIQRPGESGMEGSIYHQIIHCNTPPKRLAASFRHTVPLQKSGLQLLLERGQPLASIPVFGLPEEYCLHHRWASNDLMTAMSGVGNKPKEVAEESHRLMSNEEVNDNNEVDCG